MIVAGVVGLNTKIKQELGRIDGYNSINLLGLEKYESFYENSLKAKKKIIDMMGGELKIIQKVSPSEMKEESERVFRANFRNYIKKEYGITKLFFVVAGCITESNMIDNRHKSGMKFTKKVKILLDSSGFDPSISNNIVLKYSMMKNSFILPESYLVISVDPIDFIYMGVGRGWNTCYSYKDGSHFTGAISSGLDKVSFLTYFTTDIDSYEDKLYRRLGIFSKDYTGMMLSTQYPYKNESFEKITVDALREIFLNKEDFVELRNQEVRAYKKLSSQVFNDFVSSSSSKRERLYIGKPREGEILYYGEMVKCFLCNERKAEESIPICEKCNGDIELKTQEGITKNE